MKLKGWAFCLFLIVGVTAREGDMYLKIGDRISDTQDLYNIFYFMKCKNGGEFHLKCLDDTSSAEIDKPHENTFEMKRLIVNDKKLENRFMKHNVNFTMGTNFKYVRNVKELRPYLHVHNEDNDKFVYANAFSILPEDCLPDCNKFTACCFQMVSDMPRVYLPAGNANVPTFGSRFHLAGTGPAPAPAPNGAPFLLWNWNDPTFRLIVYIAAGVVVFILFACICCCCLPFSNCNRMNRAAEDVKWDQCCRCM